MAELVIHSGLKLNGSLPVSVGEPLLSLDSTTGVVGQENSVGGNPFADNEVLLNNATDSSKEAKFSLEQLTTGTARTYTLPDVDGTLAVTGDYWATIGTSVLTGETTIDGASNELIFSNLGYTQIHTGGLWITDDNGGGLDFSSTNGGIHFSSEDDVIYLNANSSTITGYNKLRVVYPVLGTTSSAVDLTVNTGTAENNVVKNALLIERSVSNGTFGSNGIGTSIGFRIKNAVSGSMTTPISYITYELTDVTENSEDGKYTFSALKAGTDTEIIEIFGDGAQYLTDHSGANATNDRWIPDKAYVDSVAGGSAYWPLGGSADLASNVTINDPTGTLFLLIGQMGQNLGGIGMYGDYIETRAGSYVLYQDGASSPLSSNILLDNGDITFTAGDDIILQTNLADVVITTPQGSAKYTSDYSAYYTNRSLVDKEYVDSVAGGGSSSLTIEDVSTTTYNFVEADLGKVKHFTNAAGCTATVPVGLTTGWNCTVYRGSGAGTLTIASSGTLESAAATLDTEKTAATVFNRGTDIHVAVGALGSSGGGGGGITNGAAANELMRSDGTNAVSSGIFTGGTGAIILGSASIAGDRSLTASSSSTDSALTLVSKANGQVTLSSGTVTDGTGEIVFQSGGVVRAVRVQSTTGVEPVLKLQRRIATISPSAGIGASVQFEVATQASNYEIGATLEAIATDVTAGSEDFDIVLNTMSGGATASEKLRITSDGRLYGTALHNNTGAVTGTANQYVASGTYTPTVTASLNITSTAAHACQYTRVGNVVTVSGQVQATPTAGANTDSGFTLTLPIASDFTLSTQLAGCAGALNYNVATAIVGDITGNTASFRFLSPGTAIINFYFTFTYVVV